MRVGLCGSGSTGKTTIAVALAEHLGITYVPSVARSVMVDEWGLESELDGAKLPEHERYQLQHMMFVRRLEVERKVAEFVADRTTIDHVAYCLMHCWSSMSAEEIADMLEKTRVAMSQLDVVFFVPSTNVPKRDDEFRNGTGSMREVVDVMIRGLLDRIDVRYIVVPPGSKAEQFTFVHKHVVLQKRKAVLS